MNKDSFNALVKNYSTTVVDISELKKLKKLYPYSQSLHILDAKMSRDKKDNNAPQTLTTAAFYITDRKVLKSFILAENKPDDQRITNTSTTKQEVKKQEVNNTDIESVREEVLSNVHLLAENREAFNDWLEKAPIKKESHKPAKQKKPTKPKTNTGSKAKASQVLSKKGGQDDIISKFIESSPSITSSKSRDKPNTPQVDLSKKSVVFREDIVSQNLAEIFARQGKANKAIDIYKKLIWKFPQKKASFAARIEELKKK